MGVVQFLYHPDTVLTVSDLRTSALSLLAEILIPGVEATPSTPGTSGRHSSKLLSIRSELRASLTRFIEPIPMTTLLPNFTLSYLMNLKSSSTTSSLSRWRMILGLGRESSVLTSSISITTAVHTPRLAKSVTRNPIMVPPSAIAPSLYSSSVG